MVREVCLLWPQCPGRWIGTVAGTVLPAHFSFVLYESCLFRYMFDALTFWSLADIEGPAPPPRLVDS